MVDVLADFIGVDADFLTSDMGIVLMLVITASLIYVVFKAVFSWFNAVFMK